MPRGLTHDGGGWMLTRLLLLALCLGFSSPAYAITYWDDEMEVFNASGQGNGLTSTTGTSGHNTLGNFPEPVWDNPNTSAPNDGVGTPGTQPYVVDSNIKFSGAGSLRYNYTDRCQVTDGTAGTQPCGGSTARNFPYAAEHYGRLWIRIPSNFRIGAYNGQTKVWGVRSTQGLSKVWFNFQGTALSMLVSAENTPNDGQTSNLYLNYAPPRDTWTCLEWRIKANTPGQPNGLLDFWVNGSATPTRSSTNIQWRGSTNTSYLNFHHPYRQSAGPPPLPYPQSNGNLTYLWFDRVAYGNTRIGCSGTPPPQDTTNPNPPTNLTAQ